MYAGSGEVAAEIFWARLVNRLILPTVTAFIAVVIGASAIADEREDGTILYLVVHAPVAPQPHRHQGARLLDRGPRAADPVGR